MGGSTLGARGVETGGSTLGARGAGSGGSTFGARGVGAGAGGSNLGAGVGAGGSNLGAGAGAGGSNFGAGGGVMSRGIAGGGVGARIGGCSGGWPRPGFTPSSDHAGALMSSAATQLVVTHEGEKSERRTEGRRCIKRSFIRNLRFRSGLVRSARRQPRAVAE
jgi:hypothetical protein